MDYLFEMYLNQELTPNPAFTPSPLSCEFSEALADIDHNHPRESEFMSDLLHTLPIQSEKL